MTSMSSILGGLDDSRSSAIDETEFPRVLELTATDCIVDFLRWQQGALPR